ncbi:MAG: nucleoside phosphorylase [Bacteroidota bacterium]
MAIGDSELILNADGSIYHLKLLPGDISDTIITVGDPDRVGQVSKYFDTLTLKKGKREFVTHSGTLKGTKLSVISTGIGTDNIDIVLNELDALANIDFKTRTKKPQKITLNFIRIGTSGAIQEDVPVDSFLMSELAIGLDGLLHFYDSLAIQRRHMQQHFQEHMGWKDANIAPYIVDFDSDLAKTLISNRIRLGVTITNSGFYGPQGRTLRLTPRFRDFNELLASYHFENRHITNLEMETAGIYGLSRLLGHKAVSLNAILANRATGTFSENPQATVDELIQYTLQKLTS